jgi:hypothetical protein
MDFEIQFTDNTLLEANGSFERVAEIMEQEAEITSIASHKKTWMLRSTVTIMSPFGYCMFICHFYDNKKVYIAEFVPSSKDIHTTDVRCLTYWCNHNGWSTPEPLPLLVQNWLPFWKKEWETHIIDSEYLDKRFGSRREIAFENDTNINTQDYDDDDMDV